MKKLLLMLAFGAFQLGWSQGANCTAATNITANGVYSVAAVNGTYYPTTCPGAQATGADAPTAGVWYQFTPASSGLLTITSNLPANDGVTKSSETRLSVFTGTCAALTCLDGSDDISNTNYRSELSNLIVTAGTTYFIQWDNQWGATLPFDFQLTFTAQSCLPPDAATLTISNVTATSATIGWTAAQGTPGSYDIEYGAPGFVQGTGTIANVTTNSYNFTGTAGNTYYFYLRSNCGGSQSTWLGPYAIFLVKALPYSANFDGTPSSDGFAAAGWTLTSSATLSQSPNVFYYSPLAKTAASNSQLYSRAIQLAAGETVNLNYYSRMYYQDANGNVDPTGTATGTVKLYFNTTRSLTGATAFTVNPSSVTTGVTYSQKTGGFTAPTAGIYYVIFSNETPASNTAYTSFIFLDTVALTSTNLGTKDIEIAKSNISLYPNPVSDVLHVKADGNIKSAMIYDASGKLVNASLKGNEVDVRELQSGNYIISIETENGTISEKFIKK